MLRRKNRVDEEYLNLLSDVVENGVLKETRSGEVKSLFGRTIRFDLKRGFPMLTTKKMYYKGIIHELLWFLSGNTNIKYLVDNNVHIWDDDAYRWYKTLTNKHNQCIEQLDNNSLFPTEMVKILSKEDFLKCVINEDSMVLCDDGETLFYTFGDLGPVYGKQWRSFGESGTDQINKIIETLKTNPNDRRMLCVAFNPDVLDEVALPPCHVMFQFYVKELTYHERLEAYLKRHIEEPLDKETMMNKYRGVYFRGVDNWISKEEKEEIIKEMDDDGTPRYGLSCMWTQRSVDVPLGLCWNIFSYALLTHIIAKLTNMLPDELIGSLGDCHVYLNQMEGVQEHLTRLGYNKLPSLIIDGDQKCIEDFKFDDFRIIDYECEPAIKMPLSVG